jgi:hypothetical protein
MKIVLYDGSENHRDITLETGIDNVIYFSDENGNIIMRLDVNELQLAVQTLIQNDKIQND